MYAGGLSRLACLVIALAACGDDGVHHLAPSCVANGTVTASATTPPMFACHEPFTSVLVLDNPSCDDVTIGAIELVGTVTGGDACAPPPDSMYQSKVATVAANTGATILDLTGGEFCCMTMACPASFQCDESYTFTVMTSAGAISTPATTTHLDLDACDEICP